MTPEEIKNQMLGSAGIKKEDPDTLYNKADTCFKNQSYQEAFALAKRAADQGHAAACNLVGLCYANGSGVAKNLTQAKAFFERSAQGGFPRGIKNLALTALDESCGPPDYAAAVKLLNEAEEAGERKSPAILARLYLEGRGVTKDLAKALDLLKKGIERGDEVAFFHCAKCYRDGVGVGKDLQEALSLANQSREKGYQPAAILATEIEQEIQGKPPAHASVANPKTSASINIKEPRRKSMPLAILLAILFGPLGLFYVSWKRALAMLLLFIVGVSLIPNNGFVTLLLWLVAPVASLFALGLGPRQPPPA